MVLALCLVVPVAGRSARGEDVARPREFEWNRFLSGWQLLGPFPKSSVQDSGLDTDYGFDDASLKPGPAVKFKEQAYSWIAWDRGVVDWNQAFHLPLSKSRNLVAYAWTTFESPNEQSVLLSIGGDDSLAVWLNGKEICRDREAIGPCKLDQHQFKVSVQAGTNTLLLKVGQKWGEWEAIARFLPVNETAKNVTLALAEPDNKDLGRMPTLTLDLMGENDAPLKTIHVSGHRLKTKGLGYSFVPPELPQRPAKVRITYREPGLAPFELRATWDDVIAGNVTIPLKAEQPLHLQIVDADSQQPVPQAQVWKSDKREMELADDTGHLTSLNESPLTNARWIAADGYEALQAELDWPRPDVQVIALKKGGHTLRGIVHSPDGQPLSGAKIDLNRSGFDPLAITDAEGRFAIFGLTNDGRDLYPVVTCRSYVAKDRFSQKLTPGPETTVDWELEPGATITGKVVAKSDGRPLKGISIIAGHDRFSSNHVDPTAKTDAQGSYRLTGVRPGPVMLNAFSDDFAPAMATVQTSLAAPAEQNFEIEDGQPVTGRIVDQNGKPVEKVWIITDTWNGARMFRRETYTNGDGWFTLHHMPATAVKTNALKNGYVSQRELMVKGGDHVEVTLPAVIEHTVRVRLADRDDAVPDLQIQKGYLWTGREQISWTNREWEIDRYYDKSTGVYRIRLDEPVNGKISFRFRYPGYEEQIIEAPTAGPARQFNLVLKKIGGLRARVVSAETGEGLAGISVALVSKSDKLFGHYVAFRHPGEDLKEFTGTQIVSGADGWFELPKTPNPEQFDIVLVRNNDSFVWIPQLKDFLSQQQIELPFPAGGTVEGTLTIAGEPAVNESIRLDWLPPTGQEESWDFPFGVGGQFKTDAQGHFRFSGLGPGKYRLYRVKEFSSPGRGGISMYMQHEDVVLHSQQVLQHDIHQPAGHGLTVLLTDESGHPLADCIVTATVNGDRSQRIDAVRADATGRALFRHLPAGSYELSADHYCTQATGSCGLGDVDLRGSDTAQLPRDGEIKMLLEPALPRGPGTEAKLKGTVAPELAGPLLEADRNFTLSEHWGKVVAIDFWATWCGPCMAVMPQLKELHEKYKNSSDVVFVTISLDTDEEQLKKTLAEKGLEFPVIFSGNGWSDALAQQWGVSSIPSSFVVGRDGRFASEKVHGSQLAAAVESALQEPIDPRYASGSKPARLLLQMTLDGESSGFPGAKFHVQAQDAAGNIVREEDLSLLGQSSQLAWLYPPLGPGGKVTVTAMGTNLPLQKKVLESPSAGDAIQFAFQSPRTLTGRVTTPDEQSPVPGVTILLAMNRGFRREVVSDEQGRFHVGVLPGKYSLQIKGNDRFAPMDKGRRTVEISSTVDHDPVAITVAPAAAVTGTVIGADGLPVPRAKVGTASANIVTADEHGKFEIAGISTLETTAIYATDGKTSGQIQVTPQKVSEPQQIVLGQGMERAGRGRLHIGATAPQLTLSSLDGRPAAWSATDNSDRLVVFCALWHPRGRQLAQQAATWGKQHGTPVEIVSLDWTPAQAQRLLSTLDLHAKVYHGGAEGLDLDPKWGVLFPAQACMLGANGTIKALPAPGELPLDLGRVSK
jgi:thiol-disulfide isomerase/thioredoxin